VLTVTPLTDGEYVLSAVALGIDEYYAGVGEATRSAIRRLAPGPTRAKDHSALGVGASFWKSRTDDGLLRAAPTNVAQRSVVIDPRC
jgi:hypothetical protein